MHLTEVAPLRWTVRARNPKRGEHLPILGTVEYHEFYTYIEGARVKSGFWTARLPASSWKDNTVEYGGWKKVESKDDAVAYLKRKARIKS